VQCLAQIEKERQRSPKLSAVFDTLTTQKSIKS
jgi:hypothetical protein